MHKGPPASVPIDLLSPAHVDVMCKGTWPASVSHMQYACTPELKRAYLNPKLQTLNPKIFQWIGLSILSILRAILFLGFSHGLGIM